MSEKKYIVLQLNEDGEVYISFKTKKEIQEDYFDDPDFPPDIFHGLPNVGYDVGILIIDGKIVVPTPKEKIIEWEF